MPIGCTSPPSPAWPMVRKPTSDTSALLREGGVEGHGRRREVRLAHEREGVRRAPVAVHPGVLPLDRERPVVADPVERADHRLEVDVAVAGGDEVPAAARLAEVEVPAEDRAAAVEPPDRVLDVGVEDPVAELGDEGGRVEELVLEVARGEVDAEAPAVADRLQRLAGGDEVVGDLRRVDLERELHALGLEHVDDRPPALGELLVAGLDDREVVRRERVQEVPDRRAGEAGDDLDAELRRRARGVLHPLRGALPDALRIAVAPDLRVDEALVAAVDRVGDRLADEVVADRPDAQPVVLEQLALPGRVGRVAHRRGDVEVSAPARQLEPVEAPGAALRGEVGERQIGPLAGEQRDGTAHGLSCWGLAISSRTPAARYSSATPAGSSASVTIASSSCARAIDSSDDTPNFVASISPMLHSALARAALMTSASGRRLVVRPWSSPIPAAETNATAKLSSLRNSTVQRPAIIRMCWSSSPGVTITWIASACSS